MARPKSVKIVKRVTTDLRIEPTRGDSPARLIASVVGQDKDGNTLWSDTLNLDSKTGDCPPAVRQAIGIIENYVKAWGEDG